MDPYLEDPELWRDAHHRFISAADEQLQPQLNPRGYCIAIESRIWLERSERLVYPDVALLRAQQRLPTTAESPGGTLVADEPVRLHAPENEVREDYLQIYEFYPVDVRSRLPRVRVPLNPEEPDVVLDLQAALARVYEAGAYHLRIDYNREPLTPLTADEASWANEWLIARGARSATH